MDPSQSAGWHPDPWHRHESRYWDGSKWTEHVASGGRQSVDREALATSPPAAPTLAAPPAPPLPPPARPEAPDVAESATVGIPRFGARGKAVALAEEVDRLRAEAAELRLQLARYDRVEILTVVELQEQAGLLRAEQGELQRQISDQRDRLEVLRGQVVATEDEAVLQEVGVYEYRHPLDDVVAYQAELARLRDQIKTMTRRDGGAVTGSTSWTVNGSLPQGRKMVRDFSKLMLRAYNAEADNLVRGLKPYKLQSAIERLTKVATTIVRLGTTMDIQISQAYHDLRIRELELTADSLEKKAEQKEREREERERLREERKAQQEMERERQRLEKERQLHANALAALQGKGDDDGAARLEEQLAEIDQRIEDVDYRAANIRAGYVYVISNLGSFGEGMVKIGMTRRLDPMERIRELGDASVPFKFDVHAVFFSQDAVGIEHNLHQRLADRRVNLVNRRREFFYATPSDVKEQLAALTGELLEYTELSEAVEYRQSTTQREQPAVTAPSN
jgi:hypothetical protein